MATGRLRKRTASETVESRQPWRIAAPFTGLCTNIRLGLFLSIGAVNLSSTAILIGQVKQLYLTTARRT